MTGIKPLTKIQGKLVSANYIWAMLEREINLINFEEERKKESKSLMARPVFCFSLPPPFLNPENHCYGLNMKCPPEAHVLKAWSLAGDAILEDSGNFRRWGLAGRTRSQGMYF
jgi:hypothetical protein